MSSLRPCFKRKNHRGNLNKFIST
ncbi:hypothetical protein Rin_00010330, partial [Candidatus Regiella insecticola 5.15]